MPVDIEYDPLSKNHVFHSNFENEDKTNSSFSNKQKSYFTRISVVIPAFNEENRIGKTIKDIEDNIPEILEIIVVFDGLDNTPKVAKKRGNKVKVLEFSQRLGHGGAVFEGIKVAQGDAVCILDADGASPWYEVRRLISMCNPTAPAIIGSRWVKGANVVRKEHFRNLVGGRVYHYLAFLLLGVREKDSFCGLKVFTIELANILAKRITIKDRTFNIAITYHLKLLGVKPREVGIEWSHKEESKLPVGIKTISFMFLTLLGLKFSHSNLVKQGKNFSRKFREIFSFF